MHLDEFRDHCLAKPGTSEGLPFGPDALVFKVGDPEVKGGHKMFALLSLERTPPTATSSVSRSGPSTSVNGMRMWRRATT